jgi:urease accessory protein
MFDAALRSDPAPTGDAQAPRLQRARGRSRLSVAKLDGATRLQELYQDGCAKLRCPKTYGSEFFEAVLLNTAGGLTGGDHIETDVRVRPGAALTVTGQTCERIYKSSGGDALVETRLSLGEGAHLEWMPQETILFDRGRIRRSLNVEMASNARLLAVEPIVFGRVASGETLGPGLFRDSWRIHCDGDLRYAEETCLDGEIGEIVNRPATLNGAKAIATVLYAAPDAETLVAPARESLHGAPVIGGVTYVNGVLLSRLIARDSMQLRAGLIPFLSFLRDGRDMPRAWHS